MFLQSSLENLYNAVSLILQFLVINPFQFIVTFLHFLKCFQEV